MPRQSLCRFSLSALLIACILPVCASASMLDPDSDYPGTNNTAPSSTTDLKNQLDAARQQAGSTSAATASVTPPENAPAIHKVTTTAPVIHKEVINAGVVDDTVNDKPKIAAQAMPFPSAPAPAPVAKPVSQQLVQFEDNGISTPAPSGSGDMNSLLYDDVPSTPPSKSVPVVAPEATRSVPAVNPVIETPKAKTATRMQPVQQAYTQPVAMPPPATLPLPETTSSPVIDTAPPVYKAPRPVAAPKHVPARPYVPAVEIRKAPEAVATSRFKPMPSKARGDWKVHDLGTNSDNKGDAACMLQNRFDNNLVVVIGEDATGRILLAIDYGIDMFNSGQTYKPKVEIDDLYSQEVSAFANGSQRLMIQMDKDSRFFAALQSGNALHVGLRGTASTFSLENMNQGIDSLAQCASKIGAPPFPGPMSKGSAFTAGQSEMPSVPVPPVSQENINDNGSNMAPPPIQRTNQNPEMNAWADSIVDAVRQTGITPYMLNADSNQVQWQDATGLLHSNVKRLPVADLIDASSLLLDQLERGCGGQFGSQMGVPERRGSNDVLQMETKCVTNGNILVSTWAIVKDARGVTAWQMEAPRDNRGLAFDQRQMLLNALTR